MTTTTEGLARLSDAAAAAAVLPVCEQFGPTVQGEGPYCGRLCSFVRLGHCPLACSWCDTPFSWDSSRFDVAAECPDTPWGEVANEVLSHRTPLVIVSGGEPLMQQRKPGFELLLSTLAGQVDVHVETAGTIEPNEVCRTYVSHFTVSPKLANSGNPRAKRIRPRALTAFRDLALKGQACFKFVAATPSDLHEVEDLAVEYGLPAHTIWIMPEGTSAEAVVSNHRMLAGAVLAHGWNTTTRLHTLLWESERKR